MKIAHLFSYAGGGGSEDYALELAKGSRRAGDDVIFIISTEGELVSGLEREGIKYIRINMESSFNPFAVLKSTLRLRSVLGKEKVDLVHTHMLREQSLVILAKLTGTKVKLVRTFTRLDQFNWKMKLLMPIYNYYTDRFIAISSYMKQHLKNNGIRNKVTLINNGVRKVEVSHRGRNFGYLGRISREKGLLEFIKSNQDKFKSVEFLLGGDGPDIEKISELINDEGLNIKLLGRIIDKDKFYAEIGVFILPSETEALPLVVLESFSAGIPVVCFDIPSLRELIQDDLRVEFGDYKKLLETAEFALKNRDRFKKENLEKYQQNYTLNQMVEKTNRLYRELV